MGHPADPIMRVDTSGTEARGKHYSNDPATPGFVFTSMGPDEVPTWAPGGAGADVFVNRVVFVDADSATATQTGTLNHPFATVQQAVDLIITNTWNDAVIMVAPGVYPAPVVIPALALVYLAITGWTSMWPLIMPGDLPLLTGDFTVNPSTTVSFSRLGLNGTQIAPPTIASQDLHVQFSNCRVFNQLRGANIQAAFLQTDMVGAINGGTSTALQMDGFTWATITNNAVAINPPVFSVEYYDHGADTGPGRLDVADMSVGATLPVMVPYFPANPNDFAIASLDLPAATDFTLTFSHCDFGEVWFRLTNDSRASGDFGDTFTVAVFHANMAIVPPRPPS